MFALLVRDNWTSNVGWQQTTRTEEIDTLEDVSFDSDVHEIEICKLVLVNINSLC